MRFVLVAALSIAACAGDGDDIPCEPFPDYHSPQVSVQDSVAPETLVCMHIERTYTCPSGPDECCYDEKATTTGGEVDCSTIQPCGAYDETACLADSQCFVARNDVTNAFIGCYLAYRYGQTTASCSERSVSSCYYGGCAAIYSQATDGTRQFVRCVDP